MAKRLARVTIAWLALCAMVFGLQSPSQATGQFELVGTINVSFSSGIVVSGDYAYVASSSDISIIDTTTNVVIDTVATTGARAPQGAAAMGDNVYFAAATDNKLIILNTLTRTVSYLATTGCSSPNQLVVVSSTRLIANCHGSGNVQIYDVTTPAIAGTVTTGGGPRGMSTSGGLVFVPNSNVDTMTIVDAAATPPVAVRTVNVGDQPEFTAYLDGKIYAANFAGNSVSIVDSSTGTIVATPAVGNNPQGIASCSGNVYTSNRWTGNTSVISPTTNTVINTLSLSTVGAITHVMGVNGNYAYFLNFDRSSVSVVDCADQITVTTVSIEPNPAKVAFSSRYAYITGTNVISVISIAASQAESSSPSSESIFELSLTPMDGTVCSKSSQSAVRGTWVTLPGAKNCNPPASKPDATLLGWSTTPDFPLDLAQRQVDNGWGTYEIFNDAGRITAVFIPAGQATFLSGTNTLYAIWNK